MVTAMQAAESGYLHPRYAESLREFGVPRELPRSKGWVLVRQIPGFSACDAMGCYPLFVCRDWSQLAADFHDLAGELVSLAVVLDPFGEYEPTSLRSCFPDTLLPFKQHHVVDLSGSPSAHVHPHHRRYARRALRELDVERCEDPTRFLDVWVDLYAALTRRHQIQGVTRFSRSSFDFQLRVPGLVAFRAIRDSQTVGMVLWYLQGEVGYYHLGASSDVGYELHASFALFWRAIEHFTGLGLRWLSLGGGGGIQNDTTDGLSRFKRGWATATRTAYFCGRIFDRAKYDEIAQATGNGTSGYFPAYRAGEFM